LYVWHAGKLLFEVESRGLAIAVSCNSTFSGFNLSVATMLVIPELT
jgi:hypothetical protein